jgi:2-polyprenyl-3-methyl-5-hydroxy-6-metoxy-1,4-benzoquinol methylase
MSDTPNKRADDRWQRERDFFDRRALDAVVDMQPVATATLERYGTLRRPFFSPEYRYRTLGDLAGKQVLDVGCGEGNNAVILAKLGATVTGIDISDGAIQAATRRALINGVADRTRFECSPLELARFEPATFDVIWCEAILHHLLADLETTLERLTSWTKPDGTLLFAEPVTLSRTLRRVRLMLPIHTDATPDERPLEVGELALVSRFLRNPTIRYFGLFGRLDRFVIPNENYEAAPTGLRATSMILHLVDYGLLSLPYVNRLAGACVIHGSPLLRQGAG